jgi:hypothetical protein
MADDKSKGKNGEHQTDLAEGERETVDEDLRIQEEREKQQDRPAESK